MDHDRTIPDWITVTHDNRSDLSWCLRGPTERLKTGINTYRTAVRDGHGTILASDGPEPRPHMLIMGGKALKAWRADGSVRDLIVRLASKGVNCTRIDLTRDTTGDWTPYRLEEVIEADRYVSPWHRFHFHHGKGNHGLTVECGSRSSTAMLRCYDKKAEMEAAGETCLFDRLSRWELELKGKLARKAFRRIARLDERTDPETGEVIWPLRVLHSAWLEPRLRITDKPVDRDGKNQSHTKTLPEWDAFLAGAADDILAPDMDERSPAAQAYEMARWAARSLAPTAALFHELGGDDLLAVFLDCGRGRSSAKHGLILEHRATTLDAIRSGFDAA